MFKRFALTLVLLSTLFTAIPAHADSTISPVQRLGTGIPTSIAASPDGKTLAVGSSIGVWLLDATTLQPVGFWDTGFWVDSVAYSTDGKYVKANEVALDATNGGRVDVETGLVAWIDHHCTFDGKFCSQETSVLEQLKDDKGIVATNKVIYSTNIVDRATKVEIKVLETPIKDLAWSVDGATLYYVLGSNVKAYSTKTWTMKQQLTNFFTGPLDQLIWSADSLEIASGKSIWDISTAEIAGSRVCWWAGTFDCKESVEIPTAFRPHHIAITSYALSSDNSLIVTSGADNLRDCTNPIYWADSCLTTDVSTRLWNSKTLAKLTEMPVLLFDARLSGDTKLIIGHTLTSLEAWDRQSDQRLWSVDEPLGYQCPVQIRAAYWWCGDKPFGVAVDPLNRYIATFADFSTGSEVKLRKLDTGEFVVNLTGHTANPDIPAQIFGYSPFQRYGLDEFAPITGVAFSPDGTKLAASSGDGTILIWNVP